MEEDTLDERCRRIVAALIKQNGWSLAQANDAFVETVRRRVVERFGDQSPAVEIPESAIRRAVMNGYCVLVYEAFHNDGSKEQAVAMEEMKRYVYRRLLVKAGQDEKLADECAQDAVTQSWLKLNTVRSAESFLYFALRIGIRAFLETIRKHKREIDLPEENGDDPPGPPFTVPGASVTGPPEAGDWHRRMRDVIARCLPRPEEARLMVERYLEGKSYKEMSKSWGKSANYLQVLKFRAAKRLMACQEFLDLWHDWQKGN